MLEGVQTRSNNAFVVIVRVYGHSNIVIVMNNSPSVLLQFAELDLILILSQFPIIVFKVDPFDPVFILLRVRVQSRSRSRGHDDLGSHESWNVTRTLSYWLGLFIGLFRASRGLTLLIVLLKFL